MRAAVKRLVVVKVSLRLASYQQALGRVQQDLTGCADHLGLRL